MVPAQDERTVTPHNEEPTSSFVLVIHAAVIYRKVSSILRLHGEWSAFETAAIHRKLLCSTRRKYQQQ